MKADTVFHGNALKGSLWSLSERQAVTSDFFFLMAKLVFALAKDPLLCKLLQWHRYVCVPLPNLSVFVIGFPA